MRINLVTVIVIGLLLMFTLPAWTGLFALAFGQFRGDVPLGRFFFLTLFEPSSVWDLVRTGLAVTIAAIAAMSVADKWDLRTGTVVIALLVMFLPLLVLFVWLFDPVNGRDIWQPTYQGPVEGVPEEVRNGRIDSDQDFQRVWNTYLAGQLQVLAAHLAIFLGLSKR